MGGRQPLSLNFRRARRLRLAGRGAGAREGAQAEAEARRRAGGAIGGHGLTELAPLGVAAHAPLRHVDQQRALVVRPDVRRFPGARLVPVEIGCVT